MKIEQINVALICGVMNGCPLFCLVEGGNTILDSQTYHYLTQQQIARRLFITHRHISEDRHGYRVLAIAEGGAQNMKKKMTSLPNHKVITSSILQMGKETSKQYQIGKVISAVFL